MNIFGLKPFASRLRNWQTQHGRNDLPWVGGDAYQVWLSEVMLQQTQVVTVIAYYHAFLAKFPTVHALAAAPVVDVLSLWSGLGYYSRARNLHKAAQKIVAEFDGIFPSDVVLLQTLPGVGRSTAGAIASLACGQRAAILDGNVRRVLARHAGIAGWTGSTLVAKQLWLEAESRLPESRLPENTEIAKHASEHYRRHTQGLMDLGASLCSVKTPQCGACPVAQDCVAYAQNLTASMPAPRPKKIIPLREETVLVLHNENGVWLQMRPDRGIWGGLWSLPPSVENNLPAWRVPKISHTFTHFKLNWTVFAQQFARHYDAKQDEATHSALPFENARFVAWADLASAPLPVPVRRVLLG